MKPRIELKEINILDIKRIILLLYSKSSTIKLKSLDITEIFIIKRNNNMIHGKIKLIHTKEYYYEFILLEDFEFRLTLKTYDNDKSIPVIPNSPINYVNYLVHKSILLNNKKKKK